MRSPFVVNVHELEHRPGAMVELDLSAPAPADLGTDVIGVPEGTELDIEVRLESVLEGVLATGTVRGRLRGECVRCLEEIDREAVGDLQDLYVYPGRRESGDEDDEVRELQGELLDLEPAVRDALVLAMPYQPLCRPDCPGLCSECGALLADDPEHQHDITDPRWRALAELASPDDAQPDTDARN